MNTEAIRKEIEKRKAANYQYLFLSDRMGDIMDKDNCIIHPMTRTWTRNLERDMEKAIESIAANPNPDYPYRLGFCRKVRGTCDVIMLTNEKSNDPVLSKEENEINPIKSIDTMSEYVRSYEQALEDRALIEKLQYQCREKDRKITELEEELKECYSEIQDAETGQMADGTVSLINQIAPLLPALADKYFELQERKLSAMQGNVNITNAPKPEPENHTNIYEDYA